MKIEIGQKVQLIGTTSLAEVITISGNKIDVKFENDIVYGNSIREYKKSDLQIPNLYRVAKYFDFRFHKYVTDYLSEEEADTICLELNYEFQPYTNYIVDKV